MQSFGTSTRVAVNVDEPQLSGRSWSALPRDLFTLVRPKQWLKNLLVVPLALVDPRSWNAGSVARIALATCAFVVASSLVYIVNDIHDRRRDRRHPSKRMRPIASGRVPVWTACLLGLFLAGSLSVLVATDPVVWWPLLTYVLLNFAYSSRLKHISLVDAVTVAMGFVLRVLQGYRVLHQPAQVWLVAAVFAACLLVSFGRRRYELATGARAERPALADLTVAFLDHLVVISTCLTAVSAWLYLDLDAPTGRYRTWILILLFPLVLLLLFRYLALVMLHKQGGDAVATISGDRTLVGVAGLAGLVFGLTVVATYLSVR